MNQPSDRTHGLSDAQRFELLVTSVKDYAIYMLNPAGVVVSWNTGAQRFKGYSAKEIIGQHFSIFYTEEDRLAGVADRALATAAAIGKFEAEGWRVRKDGARFWAHVVIDAIRDPDGHLVGFAKITRDITERKEAAAAMERANLALFQSQKLEAIGQLTGGIAHDFDNLLAVVSNGLQVLSTQSRTHLDAKMIQSMQRAVDRGASLTQQLLSFARQQPLREERYDVNTLIRDFEPMLRRAVDRSVAIELQLGQDEMNVLVDGPRFEAALLNLVVNARDALPAGGQIRIRSEVVELGKGAIGTLQEGRYARVSVSDNGQGMPAEVAGRALEPFFTTKEPGKGTGLGLSQVYGFITQSGGEIAIASQENVGTTIDLYLPLVMTESADATDHHAGLSSETLLLVEDEPDLLQAAAEMFRSIGYEVLTASDATQALRLLAGRADIDIVFSDIVLPEGMNGVQFAREVKKLYPSLRIVLTSAYPLATLRREHGEIAEFVFVHKPYRLSDVARAIRTVR
ncbi:PAS domain S-box-containing protein [Paraburkholderia sp. GAS199]|uniref:PAS domain-containing sensor histidine kinase n=1 Tax=Paraburkholderia sp. GAS199 TaxID=3035126 RepID=UPI003D1A6B60